MSFSIQLRSPSEEEIKSKECSGIIAINGFTETFIASLAYWSPSDYQRHWQKSLERVLLRKNSCLITSLDDPYRANFINWWLLYVSEDDVVIQNHLLFMDSVSRPFTADDPYPFIAEYEMENEDGEKISQ